VTSQNENLEKLYAEEIRILDELDKVLKEMRLFLKKWREQCQKRGKKRQSS